MARPGMPLSALLCAVAAAAVQGAAVPSAGRTEQRSIGSAECAACTLVVQGVLDIGENGTDVRAIIQALQHDCDRAFGHNSTLGSLCEQVAKEALDLLPDVSHGLDQISWDGRAVCAAVGRCEVPCCAAPHRPEQRRLSLAGSDLSVMNVMWSTLEETASVVEYGYAADSLNMSVVGASHTYPFFGWRGRLHRSAMTGLLPGRTVFYRVGDRTLGLSDVASFQTLPASAGTTTPLRIASIADMGYGPNSDTTVVALTKLANAGALDLIIHNGDISYADGDQHHWDVFQRKVEPISSRVPYMVSPGNHEFWGNFTAYKNRFAMPGDTENMFYSFDVGAVHFVAMDTESPLDIAAISTTELAWLKQDLAAARAKGSQYRWRVAYGHRPLYCSNHGGQDIPAGNDVLQRMVEDLLRDNGVDLVIQGHVHDYERSLPVYKGQPVLPAAGDPYIDPKAPVYVVNGAAGNREDNDRPPGHAPWSPPTNGTAALTSQVSFGILTLNASAAAWVQIDSANSSAIDAFAITKTASY